MTRGSSRTSRVSATVLLLLLLSPGLAPARTFHEEAVRGASLVKAGDYEGAARALEAAFAVRPVPASLYNAACYWSLAGDTTRAMTALRRAADAGYPDLNLAEKDTDLEPLHASPDWPAVLSRIGKNREGIERAYDGSFKTRFESLYRRVLTEVAAMDSIRRQFGPDSEAMRRFRHDTAWQDSLDFPALVDTIRTHGWPGARAVGPVANEGLYFAFQRAPLEIQKGALPYLWRSAYAGQTPLLLPAQMEDYLRLASGQPQLYGTQIEPDPETGKPAVCLTEDPRSVDARRVAAGLDSIQVTLAGYGMTWDPDTMETRLAAWRKAGGPAPPTAGQTRSDRPGGDHP